MLLRNNIVNAQPPNYPSSPKSSSPPNSMSIPTGTVTMLPVELSSGLINNVLLSDENFKLFYNSFTQTGMKFIPERAHFFMYVSPPQKTNERLGSPVLLAILPSFRHFDSQSSSHEAVSIVAVYADDKVSSVFASKVTVGHNPFQILSFNTIELNNEKKMVERTVKRDELESVPAEKIAAAMGPTDIGPIPADKKIGPLPSLSDKDMLNVAQAVYYNLINDSFARPLYPPEGLKSMLSDTRLVQKFSMVQSQRGSLKVTGRCTSTSTSSNACSSTSTSVKL